MQKRKYVSATADSSQIFQSFLSSGTPEERGLVKWNQQHSVGQNNIFDRAIYEFPRKRDVICTFYEVFHHVNFTH